jgi:hypothetical protein
MNSPLIWIVNLARAAATTILVDEKMAEKFHLRNNVAVPSCETSVTNFAITAILTHAVELLYSLLIIMEG